MLNKKILNQFKFAPKLNYHDCSQMRMTRLFTSQSGTIRPKWHWHGCSQKRLTKSLPSDTGTIALKWDKGTIPLGTQLNNEVLNLSVACRNSIVDVIMDKQPPEVFLGKAVLKTCSKFTGEHPSRSAISIKSLSLQGYWIYKFPKHYTALDIYKDSIIKT